VVTHPRWIGAGLGALVGIIFIVRGQVLSVVFYDQGGLSTDLGHSRTWRAYGDPRATHRGSRRPVGAPGRGVGCRAGTLFSLLVVVGTLAGFALYGIWRGFDFSGSAGSFVAALPWFRRHRDGRASLGGPAAKSGGSAQSVPTAIVAVALISVTILVESRLPT